MGFGRLPFRPYYWRAANVVYENGINDEFMNEQRWELIVPAGGQVSRTEAHGAR
jgi:hypothetical protein